MGEIREYLLENPAVKGPKTVDEIIPVLQMKKYGLNDQIGKMKFKNLISNGKYVTPLEDKDQNSYPQVTPIGLWKGVKFVLKNKDEKTNHNLLELLNRMYNYEKEFPIVDKAFEKFIMCWELIYREINNQESQFLPKSYKIVTSTPKEIKDIYKIQDLISGKDKNFVQNDEKFKYFFCFW